MQGEGIKTNSAEEAVQSVQEIDKSEEENVHDTENNDAKEKEYSETLEYLPKPVYYVESPDDPTVMVAMDVSIRTRKIPNGEGTMSLIHWYDTGHFRNMFSMNVKIDENGMTFERTERKASGTYTFTPMTLDIYNEKVKHRLAAGRDFDNLDDLNKAFLETQEYSF